MPHGPTTAALAIVTCLVAGPAPALAQTVYRCSDDGGGVVFQQSPCANAGGQRIAVQPGNVVTGRPAGEEAVRRHAQRQATVREAAARGEVVEGMTAAEVRGLLGEPAAVSTKTANGSTRQQWVYRYPDGSTRYVSIGEGGVVAIQDHVRANLPRSRPCHTDLEIANAETSASSITISREQRIKLEQRVAEMRSCRH